jgi:UDP-2-acetamido-3-amino-2,3-dideoxy-glucuronate N-acetyltransferase
MKFLNLWLKRLVERYFFRIYKIWGNCNVYLTAKIGYKVSVGSGTEIGHNVFIGANSRIGAQCFIPEGVWIGNQCFIGPKVCFTNDRYPPSPRSKWQTTIIQDKVSIGAACVILPGLVIGKGALIGAGSVVTKNIPENEIWAGNPAKKL